MARPNQIEKRKQLLVEGNDYRNFFQALIDHLEIQDLQIQNFGGVSELGGFLSAFVIMPNFATVTSIGVVRDAETSATSAFQSVQSSLHGAGLTVPEGSGERDRSIDPLATTVLILPGGNKPGMLETLLCATFAESRVNRCIDDFFRCVEERTNGTVTRPEKARAHAYLATQPEPNVSVGVAAKKGYWDLNHASLSKVRSFMLEL